MMKRITSMLAVSLLVGAAAITYSQSLGELAKKEKERRQKITASGKPITNDDSGKYVAGAVTTGIPSPAPKPASAEAAPAVTAPVQPDEPVDFEGRPESFWRQSFTEARKKVQDLENESNVIVLKIADLQNKFYREDDGFKQQTIQREINKAFYEQDLNKENLGKARDQLQNLEKEARKSGALPGWIK